MRRKQTRRAGFVEKLLLPPVSQALSVLLLGKASHPPKGWSTREGTRPRASPHQPEPRAVHRLNSLSESRINAKEINPKARSQPLTDE